MLSNKMSQYVDLKNNVPLGALWGLTVKSGIWTVSWWRPVM